MKMTPLDISQRTFQKKMFGLDEAEVLEFLQIVASYTEELIQGMATASAMAIRRFGQVVSGESQALEDGPACS